MTERKDATRATRDANDRLLEELPFEDRRDFEEAERGFIAPLPEGGVLRGEDGSEVWNTQRFSFVEEGSEAPDTVNPSLWRQSQLVLKGGLFKVTDRLYQVRNADLSNLTIVEGETGLIVFDPLITTEAARWALELYFAHRPRKPVVAVVHSHSHVDHFGGVKGVVSEDDVAAGRVKIVAPAGFLEAAVAENVLAGNAMSRRSTYMYGNLLPPDPKGQVGAGLGLTTSVGTITLIPPTDEITETGQRMTIDGLTFEFLLAPDTEAPAEMHWFIEELGALTAAENCCHTLHNTYTLRGAAIRDPQAWSRYLNETIDRWGHRTEVMYGMHHWPVWGTDRVLEMLRKGRDAYRYINDQTLRLANHGHTPVEIAEMVELPDGLARHWALRGYYGSVNHNVRATYVKYLGWFDGNPANLHTLPPEEVATRYVEFMGGAEATLEKAHSAYEGGEYRWAAEVVNHVVFADPTNQEARRLQADALEQMGYQSESGPWRNFYLTGAKELREGVVKLPAPNAASPDSVRAMSLDLFFNYLGVRLNAPKAGDTRLTLSFEFSDTGEQAVLELANGALNHLLGHTTEEAEATVTLTRSALDRVILGENTLADEVSSGEITVEPDSAPLEKVVSLLDTFEFWFPIIEP
jgi:alkyl sulfatase BDS1-like metallo-beta-lactamase superfamily hydrolase